MSEQSTTEDDRPIKLTVDVRIGQDSKAKIAQLVALQASQASIVIGIDVGAADDELLVSVQAHNLPPQRRELADLLKGVSEAIAHGEVVHEHLHADG